MVVPSKAMPSPTVTAATVLDAEVRSSLDAATLLIETACAASTPNVLDRTSA